jgi:hypothetical protein
MAVSVPGDPAPIGRFAALPRWAAVAILAAIAGLIALGLAMPPSKPAHPRRQQGGDDVAFYKGVLARVRAGQPYEAAAVAQLRAVGGPLRPFLVVRPPLLASVLARLPDVPTGDKLLALLSGGVILAWAVRFFRLGWPPTAVGGGALLLFTGVAAPMVSQNMSLLHEAWAGLLIAASLALRDERRWGAAVLLGLLAALIRELAMPYLLVMALAALAERRRNEAVAFALALGVSIAALAWHAQGVLALTTAHDLASPGWLKFGGWPFVMATAKWNLLVILGGALAGAAVSAVLVPLALAGAAGRRDGLGLRLALLLGGYTLGFMAIGRPENSYWGLLTMPLLAVGLCLAPMALVDLTRRAANRPGP